MRTLETTAGAPPRRPTGSFRVTVSDRSWSFTEYVAARACYEALEEEAALWEMDDDPRLVVAKIWR